jgi:Family of unknown function (DUF5670)
MIGGMVRTHDFTAWLPVRGDQGAQVSAAPSSLSDALPRQRDRKYGPGTVRGVAAPLTARRGAIGSARDALRRLDVGRHALALAMHDVSLEAHTMLLALAAIIAIAWVLGFTVFHVASGAIHILIVVAIIVAIVHFVQGRRAPL